MSTRLVIPAAAEPVSLAEAKLQCRVDDTAADTLLAIYIAAARTACENHCPLNAAKMSRLIAQTWDQVLDGFPAGDAPIRCAEPPLRAVSSITYVDAAGVTQTLDPSAYVVDAATGPGWVLPAAGTSWPTTDGNTNSVTMRFTCGLAADAAGVPADIKAWLLLQVRRSFDQADEPPSRHEDALLAPYVHHGMG